MIARSHAAGRLRAAAALLGAALVAVPAPGGAAMASWDAAAGRGPSRAGRVAGPVRAAERVRAGYVRVAAARPVAAKPGAGQGAHGTDSGTPKRAAPAANHAAAAVPAAAAAADGEAAAADGDAGSKSAPLDPAVAARLFNAALADHHAGHAAAAADQFYDYLRRADPGGDSYGWAQLLLGESLEALELPYAASVYYFLVAKARSAPEVLGGALGHLEALARSAPVDEDLLYEQLLDGADFGFLPPELSAWINYVQGRGDSIHRDIEWAERRFANVDPHSPYALETQYVRGVQAVREHRDNEALDLFRAVLASPVVAPDAKNRSQLAVARLLFERARYAEAIAAYDHVVVRDLSFEEAEVLAEKAWATYYLKDYPRTLGLLHALAAPSYEGYFLPETFLLKALVYKDICHYLAAKNAMRAFRLRYGRAYEQVNQRAPMEHIDRVRRAAATEGTLARRTHLLLAMREESERARSRGSDREGGLRRHLGELYTTALAAHDVRWHREFDAAAARVAGRLLDTFEQMHVLDYEVSLAIYQPLDDRADAGLAPVVPAAELPDRLTHDYYEFDGEYWNEELSRYRLVITPRCVGPQ